MSFHGERVLVLLFLACFIFLCKESIICVNFFHSDSFSEFSYASSFGATKLHAISYIIRFDLIAAILDIELLIPQNHPPLFTESLL